MRFLADLHIHSRFSRATSRDLTLPRLHVWAQRKGIVLLGTGDVTHPGWFAEISEQLVEAEPGLYRLRPDLAREADREVPAACRGQVRFVLQGEVSSIYKHAGAVRKVHNVVYLPNREAAGRFLAALDRVGNVRSDGRPILGLPSRQVLEVLLEADPEACLVPAHIWTPWFSLLGSKSGYDSVEACFEDLAGEIFALETGLSSDPAMNWRVSALDRFALISCSDAHSPANLGREACAFDLDLSYPSVFGSLRDPGRRGFLGTVEFFPEEGKYHLDGHRKCGVRLHPAETRQRGGVCPVCGGRLTVGVLHRVEELADRPEGVRPPGAVPYERLVPLPEVVAEALGVGSRTRRVAAVCDRMVRDLGPEMWVLREAPLEEVARVAGPVVAEAVRRVRSGDLRVEAGYDGAFGTVRIFSPEERREIERQGLLFALPQPAGPKPEGGAPGAPSAPDPLPPTPVPGPEPAGPAPDLDPEQREAVEAPAGPLVIVAGPGTGKTRTLTRRIARRIEQGHVSPDQVLAVTFTNRAASEMRQRLAERLGGAARRITVCTLHRLGLDILREAPREAGLTANFALVGRDEALALLRECTGLGARDARTALEAISRAKRTGRADGVPEGVLRAYERALEERNALDLDDLVVRAARLLEENPRVAARWGGRFRFVAVDEFQDVDPAQYRMLRGLAPPGSDVTVIGDPHQSIYGFRGADPGLFQRFRADHPGARTVRLIRNYRSVPEVLRVARQILEASGHRPQALVPRAGPGVPVCLAEADDEAGEARFVAAELERLVGGTSHRSSRQALAADTALGFGDVAVLCRVRAQVRAVEAALERAGIPYQTLAHDAGLVRGRGRLVLEGLARLPREDPALPRVRAVLAEVGVDEADPLGAGWLAAAAAAPTLGELVDGVVLGEPGDVPVAADRVAVLTMHAAKGLEFPAVFVVGCEEGIIPYRDGRRPVDEAEEGRLLYVAVTRARSHLYLTRARCRRLFGETRRSPLSPYLAFLARAQDGVRTVRVSAPRAGRQLSLFGI